MSAIAESPSDLAYEEAIKTAERWAKTGASDEEKVLFLQEVIKTLSDPGVQQLTEQGMVDLAIRAIQTGVAFAHSSNVLTAFAANHGGRLPGIVPFQQEWARYASAWRTNLLATKSFARQTATEYEAYTVLLKRVGQVITKEEMQRLAAEFAEFAKHNPVDIPVNFKDVFMDMKRDVENFQGRLYTYFDQQKVQLTGAAVPLQREIDALKAEIDRLDKQIRDMMGGLAIASWWGLLAFPYPAYLQILMAMRNQKALELYPKTLAMKQNEAAQSGMAQIKALLVALVPDFNNLAIFASTWNDFHMEAVDFATKFKTVETPANLPAVYLGRIEASLAVSVPLVRGLKAYAALII